MYHCMCETSLTMHTPPAVPAVTKNILDKKTIVQADSGTGMNIITEVQSCGKRGNIRYRTGEIRIFYKLNI